MQHILLATDLEATAPNVAAFAVAIAHSFGARLTAFHAYGKPNLSLGDTTDEGHRKLVLGKMHDLIEGVRGPSFADVAVEFEAKIDYAVDGILAMADSGTYDLVVLGMREDSGGEDQFSSLAYDVLRQAKTSVLAVPPQALFHGVQEMVFATDLDREDESVLEELQDWRRNLGAELTLIHFVEDDDAAIDAAQAKLATWRERYAGRPNLHFEVAKGDFDDDIGKYVALRGGDLLVLETHDSGFFQRLFGGGDAIAVARTIEVPLLVVHGTK